MDHESTSYDIYRLSDPRDQSVRYVGMSTDAHKRYKRHLAKKDNPLMPWFQELAGHGLKPFLTIIETVHGKQTAKERELHWINHYATQGAHLENYHGNVDARSEWKEREQWLTYLNKEYASIKDPQERQLVIDVLLQLFLSGEMMHPDMYDAVWTAVEEIQQVHQIDVSWTTIAHILIKVYRIKLNGNGGKA